MRGTPGRALPEAFSRTCHHHRSAFVRHEIWFVICKPSARKVVGRNGTGGKEGKLRPKQRAAAAAAAAAAAVDPHNSWTHNKDRQMITHLHGNVDAVVLAALVLIPAIRGLSGDSQRRLAHDQRFAAGLQLLPARWSVGASTDSRSVTRRSVARQAAGKIHSSLN